MQPNRTAWVDRTLNRFYDAIARVAPEGGIPEVEAQKGRRLVFAEHGCGHYGCVMPVAAAGVVFKLTSDPTEAAFVRAALQIGEFPDGIVHYHGIYQLRGVSHRKRPVFALWRDEADDVGFMVHRVGPFGMLRTESGYWEASNYIANAQAAAGAVRAWVTRKGRLNVTATMAERAERTARENYEAIDRTPGDWHRRGLVDVPTLLGREVGAQRAALGLALYELALEAGSHNSPMVYTATAAMEFYLDRGIVLADVHLNNIGKVYRRAYREAVTAITDPGHAVFLDDRYDGLAIPELEA